MYVETLPQDNLTVLIDYYGREYSDALDVCRWWYNEYLPRDETGARALALRIDTHGERYAEGLDYEKSTEVVVNWLHVPNEYEAVRYVMGEEAFDADSLNIVKDRVRKVLFGTGVCVCRSWMTAATETPVPNSTLRTRSLTMFRLSASNASSPIT